MALTETLDSLSTTFRGPLVTPDDPDYDRARRVWNAMVDKRPSVVARCTGSADVVAAVNFREIAPDGIDAAVDGIGTPEALEVSQAVVADPARVATLVGTPAAFAAGVKVLGGMPGADPGTEIRMAARLELVDLVAAGKLEVFVADTYPLVDAAEAHREVKAGHVRGKVALIP